MNNKNTKYFTTWCSIIILVNTYFLIKINCTPLSHPRQWNKMGRIVKSSATFSYRKLHRGCDNRGIYEEACWVHQKRLGGNLPKHLQDPVLLENILAASRLCSRLFPSTKADGEAGNRTVLVGLMLLRYDGQIPSRDPVWWFLQEALGAHESSHDWPHVSSSCLPYRQWQNDSFGQQT